MSQSKQLNINIDGDSVDNVIGTPCLGKSWNFIALKILHDKRIPSLMKSGSRKESIFRVNYKLFYLHALTERSQIVNQILDEVKTDFGQIPDDLKEYQTIKKYTISNNNKFQQFITELSRVYEQKNITVRFIIDQIHQVYDIQSNTQQKIFFDHFHHISNITKPLITVASRNGYDYQSHIYICASSTTQSFRNTIIDNKISPQEKLLYSMECSLFELEKAGKIRDDAIKILEDSKNEQLCSGTHKTIAEHVKSLIQKEQKQQTFSQQNTKKSEFKNSDLQKMKRNLVKYKKNLVQNVSDERSEGKNIELYLRVLINTLSFSNKFTQEVNIAGCLKVRNLQDEQISLNKTVTAFYKYIDNQQQYQIMKNVSEVSYFYITKYFTIKLLFFAQVKQALSFLKMLSANLFDLNFMRALKQNRYRHLVKMLMQRRDFLFTYRLCYTISGLKKQSQVNKKQIKIYLGFQSFFKKFKISNFYQDQLPSIQNASEMANELSKITNQNQDQNTGSFIKSGPANPLFDFVLWQTINGTLQIAFVDVSIKQNSDSIKQKQKIFQDILTKNNKFTDGIKSMIDYLSVDSAEVEVIYFTVTSPNHIKQQDTDKQQLTQKQIIHLKKLVSQKIGKVIMGYGFIDENSKICTNFLRICINDQPFDLHKVLKHTFDYDIIEKLTRNY